MINALLSVVIAGIIETDSAMPLDSTEREIERARLDESSCEHQ